MAKNYFFPLKKSKILRKISRSGRSSSHLDLRNILSVRPHPPYEKNKLLLNEYLGDFMHFETIFFFYFFAENDFFKPTHPTIFFKPSLREVLKWNFPLLGLDPPRTGKNKVFFFSKTKLFFEHQRGWVTPPDVWPTFG